MNLKTYDQLKPEDFQRTAVRQWIRNTFVALEETVKFNRLRNDLDAYLYDLYLWAADGNPKPDPKDFGLE